MYYKYCLKVYAGITGDTVINSNNEENENREHLQAIKTKLFRLLSRTLWTKCEIAAAALI